MTESKTQEITVAKADTWQCCGFTQDADAKSCIECGAPRKAGENIVVVVSPAVVGETKTEIRSKVC
jgi:hypothetical protein